MTNWDLVGGNPAPGDPDAITAFGNMLRSQQTRVDDGSGRLTRVAGNLDTVWRDGTDAAAYAHALHLPHRIFRAFSTALHETATAADRYAAALRQEQHVAATAVAAAERAGARYAIAQYEYPTGPLLPPGGPPLPGSAGDPCADTTTAETALNEALAHARTVCTQVRTAVKAAAARFARTVEANTPTIAAYQKRLFHGGALPAATTLAGSQAYAAYERAVRSVAEAGPPSLPQKDPVAANAAWLAMSPALRTAYTTRYPALVGNTNGLPVVDRSKANLILMKRDYKLVHDYMVRHGIRDNAFLDYHVRMQGISEVNAPDTGYDPTRPRETDTPTLDQIARYKQAQAIRAGLERDSRNNRGVQTYLIAYEPLKYSDGHGRAIMSIGNPDTADNTAVCVPGLGTTVEGRAKNDDPSHLYNEMRHADPRHSAATVKYLGYDAPGFTNVASANSARHGGHQLVSDVAGLHASRTAAGGHFTVIGHSYGSTTVADAGTYGLKTDNIVLIGSPGTDHAVHAKDLGVPADHVYVGSASHDPVTMLSGTGLGNDPSREDFGGIRFAAENSGRGDFHQPFWNHSQYYTKHTDSLYNLADIATGNGHRILHDGMHVESRPTHLGVQTSDPEWSRDPDPAGRAH